MTAIGGGKDSLVTIEALRYRRCAGVVFVGNSPLIRPARNAPDCRCFDWAKAGAAAVRLQQTGAWNGISR